MAKSKRVPDALERLAAVEARFLDQEFLAPMARGGAVQVRIAGVICTLKVQPADFEGWGVFRPVSHSEGRLVRPARLAEQKRYLELFPLVRLIAASRIGPEWLGLSAHRGDRRFQIEGLVPLRLAEDVQLFEVVEARFDGSQFWYAGADPSRDPATAAYLRQALDQLLPPERLRRTGLTAEERAAYALNYQICYQASEEARRSREETRLRDALAHAGAELKDYRERPDVYTVTYEVDGQRHTSVVSRNDLTVQTAGICLSGQDRAFDLQSLVGVIREGGRGIVRVGRENAGMAEEQYWRVHPRRRRR